MPLLLILRFIGAAKSIAAPAIGLLLLLLLGRQEAQAQTYHCTLDLSAIGAGLYVQLNATKTDTGFSLRQRLLPGAQQPLLFTEQTAVRGAEVAGRLVVYQNYRFRFSGKVLPDTLVLQLTDTAGSAAGLLTGSRLAPASLPAYPVVARQVLDTMRQYLFNKAYLDSSGFQAFARMVQQYGAFLRDDLEFIGALNQEMRKLPFTHCSFTRAGYADFAQMVNRQYSGVRPVESRDLAKGTAYLKISSFSGDGTNIAAAMEQIISRKSRHLIIDLRGNTGGGAGAALQLVRYLAPVFTPAGALVTNKWFDTASRVPVQADYHRFHTFASGTTFELIDAMKQNAGVVLAVTPAKMQFKGKVYVLTDRRTASTCEPLVYALKQRGRATIVGEPTAGAMLSAGGFWLNTGYVLTLPVADYFTFDGVRLDKKGVPPDVAVPAAQALEKALALTGVR